MGKSKTPARNTQLSNVGATASNQYNQVMSRPSQLESEFAPVAQQMAANYTGATANDAKDYGNIMSGYQDFSTNLGGPTNFTNQTVSAQRPAELGESYGYLRETMPGYRNFAQTGGYSPTDIQELRARGMSPIRSAYSNTMMEMDRSRALGGAGGSPNYIAAASKAQREMPGQMADAMTGVNAELANSIRQGKLAGLGGMAGVGSTMGNMAGQESGRMLQASMANQNADLQRQQLSEQSLQNLRQSQLASLGGQTNLYGTTPARSSMFGNQALSAYQNRAGMEQSRNQLGLGLLDAQIRAAGGQSESDPWWKQALGAAGSILPYTGLGNNNNNGRTSNSSEQYDTWNNNDGSYDGPSYDDLNNDPSGIQGGGLNNNYGYAGNDWWSNTPNSDNSVPGSWDTNYWGNMNDPNVDNSFDYWNQGESYGNDPNGWW